MKWIDVERELARLERRFASWAARSLRGFEGTLQRAQERLCLRRQSVSWAQSFSPLVALYPLLQAEMLGQPARSAARDADTTHLALLIHTFLDDRHLDGELDAQRDERLLSQLLLHEALALLRRSTGGGEAIEREIATALSTYYRAQRLSHRRDQEAGSRLPTEGRRSQVVGRAAIGGLAARALLAATEVAQRQRRRAIEAYDALVMGMQWEDDLVDLPKDLATGADNLLLDRLVDEAEASGSGPNENGPVKRRARSKTTSGDPGAAADARCNSPDQAAAALALSLDRVTSLAVSSANREWARASAIEHALGAYTLAAMIDERRGRLMSAWQRQR